GLPAIGSTPVSSPTTILGSKAPNVSIASTSTPAIVIRSASSSTEAVTLTSSLSHEIGTRTTLLASCSDELPEQANVVLEEGPDVVVSVQEQDDPFDAQPEGDAAHGCGIVAAVSQDRRVHEPGSEQLEPTRLLAHPTPSAAADGAF